MKKLTLFTVLVFAIIYALSWFTFVFFSQEGTVFRDLILPIAFFGSGIIIAGVVFRNEYLRYRKSFK